MEIRAPRDEDEERRAFLLRSQAFDIPPSRFDEGWPTLPRDRHVLAIDGGRIVGAALAWDFGQFFGGRAVPMGGVAGVAVAPDRRGTGISRLLMDTVLSDLRARGEPLSALYPATVTPYRRTGWEVAGYRVQRRVPLRSLAALPAADPAVTVRPAGDDDHPAIEDHYRRIAATIDGFVDRSPTRWAHRWKSAAQDHHYAYVAERDATMVGHLLYHHGESTGSDDWVGLQVDELITADPDALLALWRLLSTNRSVSARVTYHGGPDDPLYHLLAEEDLSVVQDWRWMLRLVDVEGAVAGRGYPPTVQVTVPLTVHDGQVAANDGRVVLQIKDGSGWVEPGGDGAVELTVNALAALYSGHTAPGTLAAAGLLRGASSQQLADLAAAFTGPAAWMVDFF